MSAYTTWVYRVAAESTRGSDQERKAINILQLIYCDRTQSTIWADIECVRVQMGQLCN